VQRAGVLIRPPVGHTDPARAGGTENMRAASLRIASATIAAGLCLLVAPGFSPAHAQSSDDETCLTCHGSPDAEPRIRVEAHDFRGSAHGGLACVRCHPGAREFPHPATVAAPRCESCHAGIATALKASAHSKVGAGAAACSGCHGKAHAVRHMESADGEACAACHGEVVREYAGSVHGLARAHGDGEASTCRDCHGSSHAIRSSSDPRSPTGRDSLATTCARCHADRELMTRRRITIPAAVALYQKSVHGRSDSARAATCNDCHESHRLKPARDPSSSIHPDNVAATCGRCHTREAADYVASVHGTGRARGVRQSPTCTDCHGEHLIRGPRDADSPVAGAAVSRTCAHCHEAIGIRETYGLPAGRLASYEDSFHGLAARGGSPVAANCASCHGFHRILPSSDSTSATHVNNLPATCGKCHPGASERFARGAVHVVMARPDQPILHWVRITYLWLIALTIGGMLVHNLLDFSHKLRARLRAHYGAGDAHAGDAPAGASPAAGGASRWHERMSLAERWQHGTLAVSFLLLVFTGFALKFPEAYPFLWLARLEHGYAWRSILHRIAAVVMVAAALFHLAYLLTRRGRQLVRDLLPVPRDAVQPAHNVLYWLGLRRTPPAFERFGYIEKAEYWALIWGTVVMTVTGFALWFENQSLQWFDKWVLDLATLVHYYEAWLAFLAIVVWHFYMVMTNPDVYPMNWTWLTGRISDEQLRHEHRAEWERLQAAADAEDAAATEAAAADAAEPAPEERAADAPPAGGDAAGSEGEIRPS